MIITVDHITKSIGERVLFQDAFLRVGARDRIALVGPNGAGKTTLLEIIAGEQEPDSGSVIKSKDATIGYLKQEAIEMHGANVLEEVLSVASGVRGLEHRIQLLEEELATATPDETETLLLEYGRLRERFEHMGGYTVEAEARAVLSGLGFTERDMLREIAELSGGWQMRVALAKILLVEPDVLLLDEPTNHLDLESVTWLEGFLKSYEGALLIVSHDRSFMDGIVNRIAELELRTIVTYQGTYSSYQEQKAADQGRLVAAKKQQDKHIEQQEQFIERFRYKASKSKAVQSRVKALDKLERIEIPEERKKVRFSFPQPERTGDEVISLDGVSKAYGDNVVYGDLSMKLYRGDKIALVGPNGAGKSTLLRMLAGELAADSGTRRLGQNVSVAYFAQHQLEALGLKNTVLDELLLAAPGWTQEQARTLLGTFLFHGNDVKKLVKVLSGGERARLALAKMLVQPASFLCLDEPTNHLDIQGCDVLEQALAQYTGTIALITHDRHLIRGIANRVADVRNGTAVVLDGDYDYYLRKLSGIEDSTQPATPSRVTAVQPIERKSASSDRADSAVAAKSREGKRSEAEERNRLYRGTKDARRRLQSIDRELVTVQSRHDELMALLGDQGMYEDKAAFDAVLAEYATVKERLGALEVEWVEVSERIEGLEAERGA